VHLHACATDGVFVPTGGGPPAFLPARPITQADLAALTEKVRRRVVRWFRMQRLIDADAASDMLRWENSGFSVDASVRITLIDRDVPRRSLSGMSASRVMPRLVGMRPADMRRTEMPPATAATHATNCPPTTPPEIDIRSL